MRRVVVTGVGLLTAIGTGWKDTWNALLDGRCGIGPLQAWDTTGLRTRIGAELSDFNPLDWAGRRELRMTTRNDQLALAGARLAVQDAGEPLSAYDAERCAAFIGGGKEICAPERLLEACLVARREDGTADHQLLGERAGSAFHPLFYVEGLQSASLFHVSHLLGFRGANTYFHGTSDVGVTAIARAFRSIRRGESDLAVAGGFDDATGWWRMSQMDAMGVLTPRNELGQKAFRPFDAERSGSVLGDGSAWLVLEELESALRRGATIHAEVTGSGATYDGAHPPAPEPQGRALSAALEQALTEAGLSAEQVDHVVAHGSATPTGDRSETAALHRVLGDRTPVSCVKPQTGHLVAGAGALNAAVAALSVGGSAIPAIANLEHPQGDPGLDWVTGAARRGPVRHAVALARGLEGQQVALAFSAAPSSPSPTRPSDLPTDLSTDPPTDQRRHL